MEDNGAHATRHCLESRQQGILSSPFSGGTEASSSAAPLSEVTDCHQRFALEMKWSTMGADRATHTTLPYC
eukprot:1911784-Amphidinium_carterae.1